jgi:hypothetical protein
MTLSNHVSITISQDSVGVSRAGFGTPLILSHNASFAERVREYTGLTGIVSDGFATDSPEYLIAQACFSQNPRPERVKIGRAALQPTQVYVITPLAQDSHEYAIQVDGEGVTSEEVSFTSDASATVAEITAGLTTALNGVTGKNYTAVDGTTEVTITATAAGDWFSLEVLDNVNMKIEQTHSDPGVATDLAAISLEDNDWYDLKTAYNSNAYVLAAATWVESNKKIYAVAVNETDAINTAAGNSDTLDDLATANRARTIPIYHPSPVEFLDAAISGRCLPEDPGSITWKFKRVSGPGVRNLTATQRANLVARSANFLETVAGLDIFAEGTTADGDYVDVQRFLDWLEDDTQKTVFENMAASGKVPFTDAGVRVITSGVSASLQRGIARGGLAADPAPVVTAPKVADVSTADKTARTLPDVKFSGTLAGAIHKSTITGSVTA